jgi:thioredoxin-related protein
LAKAIQKSTTPIYINAASAKRHKFMHNGELMDVDTKTLVSIYQLTATPTLIFTDDKAQSIFVVPGYMPPKQFEVTLQFLNEKVWEGKDRKNGEVYTALKAYYEAHGVKVGEAKK